MDPTEISHYFYSWQQFDKHSSACPLSPGHIVGTERHGHLMIKKLRENRLNGASVDV
jgi:hypothetical protein